MGVLLSQSVNDRVAADTLLSAGQEKRSPRVSGCWSISYAQVVESWLKASIIDCGYLDTGITVDRLGKLMESVERETDRLPAGEAVPLP